MIRTKCDGKGVKIKINKLEGIYHKSSYHKRPTRSSSDAAVAASYHPDEFIGGLELLLEIGAMAQGTIKLILQIPFIQTVFVEDMETFEVTDFMFGEDGFEADGTSI